MITSERNNRKMVDKTGRRLAIVYRPISELKLDAANPKDHSRRQVRQIANSIAQFGFITPVVIDAYGNVVAGHGRILAASLLGWTEVATIRVDHLSEAQIRAFRIADNRLTENSTWNERLLGEQLKFLAESDLDFSIEVTGFEASEIDMYIEGLAEQREENDPADTLPEIQTAPLVTREGDRFLLGNNVVVCADARAESSFQQLMEEDRATMAFGDLPYNVPILGNVSGLGSIQHRDFAMACGEMSKEQFTAFLIRIFSLLAQYSVDGAIHYIMMDWRHMPEVLAAGEKVYTELKNLCIWVKITQEWEHFIAAVMNLFLSTSTGAPNPATT